MRWLASSLFAALIVSSVVSSGIARADVNTKLGAYELEARQLGTDLPQPNQLSNAQGQRRLVDAEVAYQLGDFDTAALMLFDLSSKPSSDQETATYYLAESLFQKGDKGAARSYYEQVAAKGNPASRYYQPSLVRLVEIAIAQRDTTNVANTIGALDRLSAGLRLPQVPYVRGKYAFFEGKYDEAIAYFNETPKDSPYELQAAYYIATTHVAKKDLARGTEVFTELVARKPKLPNDRRIIELAELALGRLYYERDQPSKAIDSYLMIDRKSALFPDALYEVAWVYVKGKQYDKALRALELLSLSEPQTNRTATVRILEGNLRIRKAQMIRNAQITGVIDSSTQNADPGVEYDKAAAVFTETHDMYMPSYVALSQMVDSTADPGQYLAQLAGRSSHVFQSTAPLPEAAAQYLREEPEVQRVVSVETDLGEVESNISQSEAIIARLEGVLKAGDRTAVYPALQSRRSRIGQIQDDLIKIRADLADQLAKGSGAAATGERRQLVQQYLTMPNAEQAYADRVAATQQEYDKLEQSAADVSSVIDQTQAVAVALRKYSNDAVDPPVPADQKVTLGQTLDAAATEAQAIENELEQINREIQLGRDLAGVGDEQVAKAREARKAIKTVQDTEHKQLASAGGNQSVIALADRAARLADNLTQTEGQIDAIVDRGVDQVKQALAQERQNLAAYKTELAEYDNETRTIGGTVLGASFKDVKAKFYDVIIRTDVGNVDVSWSQKEDNDDDLKRLNLSRQRDLKQINDEFKDILQDPGGALKPPPVRKPEPPREPVGDKSQAGSPDSGKAGERVKPAGDTSKEPAKPAVKPDDGKDLKKADPKKADPKKGAQPKGGAQPKAGGTP